MLPLALPVWVLAAAVPASCTAPNPVTAAEVARAVGRRPKIHDTIVTGVVRPSEDEGGNPAATVYVRRGTRWSAYDLDDSQEIVAVKRSPLGLTVVFGWHKSEGPGQGFSGLVFDRAGALVSCPDLEFPAALNRDERTGEHNWTGEFLEFQSIVFAAGGRGRVLASGTIDDNGRERHLTFEYISTDGGRSWEAPRPVAIARTRPPLKRR